MRDLSSSVMSSRGSMARVCSLKFWRRIARNKLRRTLGPRMFRLMKKNTELVLPQAR